MLIRRCLSNIPRRCLSTAASSEAPVELAFDHHPSPEGGRSALVIMHGLYGSKQNWRSLSRALAQRTGRDVYALDLRNHGTSPHNANTRYRHYAKDVSHFLKTQKLKDPILMGHSMGGKVAMAQALTEPSSLSKLIVVDMSPAKGKISPDFERYIDGMRDVERATGASKKDADVILQKYEESLPVRQFLLTNLQKATPEDQFRFRIPLDILADSIPHIGDFPYAAADGITFDKPTLFIKGADSKYINRRNIPTADKLFPNNRLEVIEGAGHWVHSEKPREFSDLVIDFCK